MRWFRWRRKGSGTGDRESSNEDKRHLEEFARSRQGVEAFVEPETTVTSTTVLLVAHDGEWTRRRVRDPQAAQSLAKALAIPIYDAQVVGYPQRMREWNRRASGQ